jgi:type II restriction enzyme
MNLQMNMAAAAAYKSPSRISGVITEHWAAKEMYCCACSSDRLKPSPPNNPAFDFVCPICQREYQLKAKKSSITSKIVDGDYKKMSDRIIGGSAPNLLLLHYAPQSWAVQNLLLIPSFFFTLSALEKRKPLGPHTRRPRWTGCNIVLSAIATDGKLRIVTDGALSNPTSVRDWYRRMTPLESIPAMERGWALDVLQLLRTLNKAEFTIDEAYAFEPQLAVLYPNNKHVKDKIRQQLQVLRDNGLLEFVSRGRYRLL